MSVVEFADVSKRLGGRHVVDHFSVRMESGDRLVILGPSGCGKTTVLRMLAGLIAPDGGTISIDGQVVASSGRILREPEERNLGMVFQDLALWPHLTVKGNLEFGLRAKKVGKTDRERRIAEVLKLVRMESSMDAKPAELSGGEQQRIALARALVLQPGILLMDEPLSSLDFELNLELRREIARLHREMGFTLVYVTHNLTEAFDLATRLVVMKNGSIDQIGPPEEVKGRFADLFQAPP